MEKEFQDKQKLAIIAILISDKRKSLTTSIIK